MQRLPCFYAQPELPEARLSRAELGLPEDGVIYGCPQSLYKIHPEFDQVLADIAAGDPEGHIVMIEGHPASMTNLLRKRWSRTAPILVDRVLWLPRLDFAAFISLLDHTDVLLDPIHFGSGNTLRGTARSRRRSFSVLQAPTTSEFPGALVKSLDAGTRKPVGPDGRGATA